MPITDPTDISGCVISLDPETLRGTATHGDSVTLLADQSGNGNDAIDNSPSPTPTWDDGSSFDHGLASLRFSDVATRLRVLTAPEIENAQITYAGVTRFHEYRSGSWVFNKNNANPATIGLRENAGIWQGGVRLAASQGTYRDAIESDGAVELGWVVWMLTYDGSAVQVYINNELAASLSVSGSVYTSNPLSLIIGNHPSSDLGANMWLGPFAVYNRAITSTERGDLYDLWSPYLDTGWTRQGVVSSLSAGTSYRDVQIRTAAETGEATHTWLFTLVGGEVRWGTSPTNDPLNVTDQGTCFTSAQIRSTDFVKVGGTWYVYGDNQTTNGEIVLYTGTSLSSLTVHANSPILVGTTGDYVRSLAVHYNSSTGDWTFLVDKREDYSTGRNGHVDLYTGTDGVSTPTKDTVNSPVIDHSADADGFDGTDVSHPCILDRGDGTAWVASSGFRDSSHPDAPHQIGICDSADLTFTTLTKRSGSDPILPHSHASGSPEKIFGNAPCLVDFGDGNITCVYTGKTGSNYKIVYATFTESSSQEGEATITLAGVTASATGVSSIEAASTIALAGVTGSATAEANATGSASITLAGVAGQATTESAIEGITSTTLEGVSVLATGEGASDSIEGAATITLAGVTGQATAEANAEGIVSVTLTGVVVSSTGISTVVATASGQLAGVTLVATATNGGAVAVVPDDSRIWHAPKRQTVWRA